tara:strand:- start:125 stop:406 length:282 start_codon:yes stop_codon:yes gene_type:complete
MSDMPREYVERLMRESGMSFHLGMPREAVVEQMTKFADLLRDETLETAEHAIQCAMEFEREECARVADKWATREQKQFGNGGPAAAIRARGEE